MTDTFDLGTDVLADFIADELVISAVSFVEMKESVGEHGAMLRLLGETYRDIYQETIDATGIDPELVAT